MHRLVLRRQDNLVYTWACAWQEDMSQLITTSFKLGRMQAFWGHLQILCLCAVGPARPQALSLVTCQRSETICKHYVYAMWALLKVCFNRCCLGWMSHGEVACHFVYMGDKFKRMWAYKFKRVWAFSILCTSRAMNMWLNYVTMKFYVLCRPLKKVHQIYENFNIYYKCFDF
jgi:hypothetical protein